MRLGDATERDAALRILRSVRGEDSFTGYFGARGRRVPAAPSALEAVIAAYHGKEQDVDIAFWNLEWFTRNYRERLADVAGVIADQNIDIWAFSESSPEATRALVAHMHREFGQHYHCAASEPDAPGNRHTTTVMWNAKTIAGGRRDWPATMAYWFPADHRHADAPDLEGVESKILDNYPGLFHFTALSSGTGGAPSFDFFLVPMHLKAKAEGAKRRPMACRLISAAVTAMVNSGADQDWVLGGNFKAALDAGEFDSLRPDAFSALSACDAEDNAFTYLGPRDRSLIDHIFLSPNMAHNHPTYDHAKFFSLAADKEYSDFANSLADHRPIIARLSLKVAERDYENDGVPALVRRYRAEPGTLFRRIADEFDRLDTGDDTGEIPTPSR